ncbi:MAG: nickel pincer cofactor biosynthesis protein LarC [Arenicellales bacterium]|jgi:uncharacterized protein (TIGR00299 family) protein|nr:nickel pincer cofactor biosynthesis protein LarC [Arenicellales bacterium]|tara:strand:- start:10653 stop:11897 length:1245 start_codon:yes stop_codon:yes gene_type:complete
MPDRSPIHLHLDAVGGVAGDMFVAALLDAERELEEELLRALNQAGLDSLVRVQRHDHDDGTLTGSRISVKPVSDDTRADMHDDNVAAGQVPHAHTHRSWRDIRQLLEDANLPDGARRHTLDIFLRLAEAEAKVHGTAVDEVSFHEVGAWDSIADIVMAGWLIDRLNIRSCSASNLPMGRGLVNTAHGRLPVPTPATTLLLENMPLVDDGLEGERITPTGAAILKHLDPAFTASVVPRTLKDNGVGFGNRVFPGISNILRAVFYTGGDTLYKQEQIALIEFELDDQTPEDLAVGLDHLRSTEGVMDIVQSTVAGKKNRLMIRVQIIAKPNRINDVLVSCFAETTTLGVRWQLVQRAVLERSTETSLIDEHKVGLKHATRPDGLSTAKAEMDDLANAGDHKQREQLRRQVEAKSEH